MSDIIRKPAAIDIEPTIHVVMLTPFADTRHPLHPAITKILWGDSSGGQSACVLLRQFFHHY
jgi:hypothetical protein